MARFLRHQKGARIWACALCDRFVLRAQLSKTLCSTFPHANIQMPLVQIKRKLKLNESENKTGEAEGGTLRAPLAGSPAFASAFVFVLIYV